MTARLTTALHNWWEDTSALVGAVPLAKVVTGTLQDEDTTEPYVTFETEDEPIALTNGGTVFRSEVQVNIHHKDWQVGHDIALAVRDNWHKTTRDDDGTVAITRVVATGTSSPRHVRCRLCGAGLMADLVITAADVNQVSGNEGRGIAGATITAGQSLYEDSTDSNKLKLADADASATAACVGVALHAASSGQPIAYAKTGEVDIGATVAAGAIYVVSTTAGGVAPDSDLGTGDYVTIIGIGDSTTSTSIKLAINNSQIIHA